MLHFTVFCELNASIPELQQIESEFEAICGSASSLMNLKQFCAFMIKLGFIPDLCQQCFKYAGFLCM